MLMVEARALGKEYRSQATWRDLLRGRLRGQPLRALTDVSIDAAAGEIVAVLGRNGAGKSTLLKCLGGLVVPTRGRATVAGHDCARGGAQLRRDAVYVAGDARSFAWRLSGRANLEFFAALHGWGGAAARRRVGEALARVELDEAAAARAVGEYSTGMRQRLALARAFLGEPRVLLCDEPTAGLDPKAAAHLRTFLRGLAADGRAVVLATHQLDEVRELAARAVVLDEGRVAWAGAPGGAMEAALE